MAAETSSGMEKPTGWVWTKTDGADDVDAAVPLVTLADEAEPDDPVAVPLADVPEVATVVLAAAAVLAPNGSNRLLLLSCVMLAASSSGKDSPRVCVGTKTEPSEDVNGALVPEPLLATVTALEDAELEVALVVVELPDVLVPDELVVVAAAVVVPPLPLLLPAAAEVELVEGVAWPRMVVPAGGQGAKLTQLFALVCPEAEDPVPATVVAADVAAPDATVVALAALWFREAKMALALSCEMVAEVRAVEPSPDDWLAVAADVVARRVSPLGRLRSSSASTRGRNPRLRLVTIGLPPFRGRCGTLFPEPRNNNVCLARLTCHGINGLLPNN